MDNIDIILKAITLLNRENILGYEVAERSTELAKTVLESIDTDKKIKVINGGDSDIMDNLKHLLSDMIHNIENYDKDTLLQSLELIVKDNEPLMKIINKVINIDIPEDSLKKTVVSLRNTLNTYYKEKSIINLINDAYYKLRTKNIGSDGFRDYITKLMGSVDTLLLTAKVKDQGIVNEVDLDDEENLSGLVASVLLQKDGTTKLKTGWKKLNAMIQGGFRRAETVVLNALQHRYKSGFTKSIFMQIALHNKPVLTDITKIPLLLFISFEDDMDITIDFMYKYLYYNEFKKLPDMSLLTNKEIAKYIKDRLSVNGYRIKIVRVNPSEWTYRHMFNYVLELESEGFELHACFADYLSKLPTTGCIQGPTGTDVRDLWNRTRNFFSARNILFFSPHQLSTEAKQLTRNGVPDENFVKEVQGKGYTEGTKQIDQVVDLELYIHIAKIQRIPHLTVARGKHRVPDILDDDKMYFTMPFPPGAPIPEDVNGDDIAVELAKMAEDDFEF